MTTQNSLFLKHLYCFRHGETDWNIQNRFQGRTNISLNDTGRSQAVSLVPVAKELGIEFIYTSPLSRASETAKIISQHLKIEMAIENGLSEVDAGLASGLLQSEIDSKFGVGSLAKWKSDCPDDDHFGFPSGETKNQLRIRAFKTLSAMGKQITKQKIGIVTHGFWLKRLLIFLKCTNHKGLKNGEIVHFTYSTETKELSFIERITKIL